MHHQYDMQQPTPAAGQPTHVLTHCSTNQVTVADFGVQALVTLSLQRTLGATNFRLVAEEEPDALAKDKELLAKVQCFHNCW